MGIRYREITGEHPPFSEFHRLVKSGNWWGTPAWLIKGDPPNFGYSVRDLAGSAVDGVSLSVEKAQAALEASVPAVLLPARFSHGNARVRIGADDRLLVDPFLLLYVECMAQVEEWRYLRTFAPRERRDAGVLGGLREGQLVAILCPVDPSPHWES